MKTHRTLSASALLLLTALAQRGLAQCEEAKLVAGDATDDDNFGWSVSMCGNRALIGAYTDDHVAVAAGSAYVFELGPSGWSETIKLTASDAGVGDVFGVSVSLDGNTALIGAMLHDGPPGGHASGAAYVFDRSETGWVETQKLKASDGVTQDQFGEAVYISGDTAAIAAPRNDDRGGDSGSVYIFERVGSTWVQVANLHASDGATGDTFGNALALRGDTLVVGAPGDDDMGRDSGSAYVFERIGGMWVQTAKLTASDGETFDYLGFSAVGISGSTAIVGAHCDDDGGPCTGSVYVFERAGSVWGPNETVKLHAGDPQPYDEFGIAVAIDGNRIAVGADIDDDRGDGSGSAYVFERGTSGWVQVAKLLAHDGALGDLFGFKVSVSGNAVLAGSHLDDDACPEDLTCNSGAAYVFRITGVATPYCFGESCPCSNDDPVAGCATSRGNGARLTACGSASTAADDLVLHTSGLPPDQFGIFYMGAGQLALSFGDGLRCVGGGGAGIFRYFPVQSSGPIGVLALGPGIVAHSQARFPVPGRIDPGETWNFQTWFRDPTGPCGFAFNLSNALAVTFTP